MKSERVEISVCAFESLDQACEPLDQASRVKPSMVQFVHEVHPVFVVALSVGQMMIYPFLSWNMIQDAQ